MTKDELRAELERQEQRYKDVYGGEVTTYAAQPEPERKPWRKRASLLDQAFAQEIQKSRRNSRPRSPEHFGRVQRLAVAAGQPLVQRPLVSNLQLPTKFHTNVSGMAFS